jgi:hypothetical protein
MKKTLRAVIVLTVCICLCVGYYYYLSHRSVATETQPTELEQVVATDLEKSYPTTPREVIRFYNRILLCLYNLDYSDEEFEKLGNQARTLMDDDLLADNPEEIYFASLKSDVEDYKENSKKISNVRLSSGEDVETKKVDGQEYAYVDVIYFVKGKNDSERDKETYVLRKDTEGNWRILGYYVTEEE